MKALYSSPWARPTRQLRLLRQEKPRLSSANLSQCNGACRALPRTIQPCVGAVGRARPDTDRRSHRLGPTPPNAQARRETHEAGHRGPYEGPRPLRQIREGLRVHDTARAIALGALIVGCFFHPEYKSTGDA